MCLKINDILSVRPELNNASSDYQYADVTSARMLGRCHLGPRSSCVRIPNFTRGICIESPFNHSICECVNDLNTLLARDIHDVQSFHMECDA